MTTTGGGLWRTVGLLGALLWLQACAGTPITDRLRDAPPVDLPPAVELAETPFFPQTDYYCGPATMAAALNATGLAETPDGIAAQVFTPGREGSFQTDMVTAARRHGRLALATDGMIGALGELAEGRPVLILQNLSLEIAPVWHYALLIGYNLGRQEAILRSGTERRLVLPLSTLEYTWRRAEFWGVVVVAPEGPVPTSAALSAWLSQAAGIERAGRRAEAAQAYRTAMGRWPAEAAPRLALANLLYAEGDLAGAETTLRHAVAAAPGNAPALNNLAHVLMERGRLAEAEQFAERALAEGGADRETAAKTLAEIRARRASRS